ATIIAADATLFGRLHRLAVETGGTWGGLLRGRLWRSHGSAQRVHHVLPGAISAPCRNVLVDRTFGQQVMWQHVPLAARAVEVQDGVDDLTHVHFTRAPAGL